MMPELKTLGFDRLPLAAYVLIWWAAHFVTQLLASRAIHDGAPGILILFAAFAISGGLGSGGGAAENAAFGSITPSVGFCLQVANSAGNLFLYNSMMHIPAYCSQSIKAMEVVFTMILTCMLQQRYMGSKEVLGCLMIFAGFVALSSSTRKASQPLCDVWNVGVLEVLLASVLLPVRNILFKLYVVGVSPSKGFVLLCRQATPMLSTAVFVFLGMLSLRHDSHEHSLPLMFTDTVPRLVMLVGAFVAMGVFSYVYNWASLSILGTRGVSVQFHAGLNALKRGATIALLYNVRKNLTPPSLAGVTGAGDIHLDGPADDSTGAGGLGIGIGHDHAVLGLALVLMVGGCFVTHSQEEAEGGNTITTSVKNLPTTDIHREDTGPKSPNTKGKPKHDVPQWALIFCYVAAFLCLTSTLGGFFDGGGSGANTSGAGATPESALSTWGRGDSQPKDNFTFVTLTAAVELGMDEADRGKFLAVVDKSALDATLDTVSAYAVAGDAPDISADVGSTAGTAGFVPNVIDTGRGITLENANAADDGGEPETRNPKPLTLNPKP
jgi:hypothetical protein